MLPATGSTITQAISPPSSANAAWQASRSLKGSVRVCSASAAGTPGEVGTPRVRAPDPALISSESEWPW
jgi:hypothetical protein